MKPRTIYQRMIKLFYGITDKLNGLLCQKLLPIVTIDTLVIVERLTKAILIKRDVQSAPDFSRI